jgi:hypothetical protein
MVKCIVEAYGSLMHHILTFRNIMSCYKDTRVCDNYIHVSDNDTIISYNDR